MKWLLKLLKDHLIAGKQFKAGDTVEIDDKTLVGELLADGIAEKAEAAGSNGTPPPEAIDEKTQTFLKDTIDSAIKDLGPAMASKHVSVEVHDKSDDDPTWGYCAPRLRELTQDERFHGLGQFAKDVYSASGPGSTQPARLVKCYERGQKMLDDAVKEGVVQKASGDLQQVGVDSDGGFTVPPDFSLMLNDAALETAVVRPRATVIQTGSDRVEMPQPKNYDHSSNLVHGGVIAYWKGEDSQLTESKIIWEEIGLNLNALTAMAKVTHKMMRFSAISVGSFILPKLGDAIGWKEDDGFINGTGAGMPLGILNSSAVVSVAKEGSQAATTIVSENIDKMYARLRLTTGGSPVWLYNHTETWSELAGLEREVGTAGGSAAGLVQQLANTPQMTIYGMPLARTEHCAALGTAGDIIGCNMSDYLIADDRAGLEIAQSMHLHFDYGKEVFRIIKYTDGQPRYSDVFTPQKGTATAGSFTTVAVRA